MSTEFLIVGEMKPEDAEALKSTLNVEVMVGNVPIIHHFSKEAYANFVSDINKIYESEKSKAEE